jgi:hypothetical protein
VLFVLVFLFINCVEGTFVSDVGSRPFIYETLTALNVEIYEKFHIEIHKYIKTLFKVKWARRSAVGWELRYKSEDRGFDSRWCHWNFPAAL